MALTVDPDDAVARIPNRVMNKIHFTDNCWLWTGWKNDSGYAMWKKWGAPGNVRVHRLMYEEFIGPIPEGLVLDHECRVRHCVNPHHLRPMTIGANVLLGEGPLQTLAKATHCKHGHEFNEENTYWIPNATAYTGRRQCRVCRRERSRAKG